jgi:mRNA interferase MazF
VNPGDICLVAFPYSDASAAKKRPVLVVGASPVGRGQDEVVVVAQITSSATRIASPLQGDLVLTDWRNFRLPQPSVLRCRRLFAINPTDVLRQFGNVDGATLAAAHGEIRKLFGF